MPRLRPEVIEGAYLQVKQLQTRGHSAKATAQHIAVEHYTFRSGVPFSTNMTVGELVAELGRSADRR